MNRLEKLHEFLNAEPNDPFLKYALATEYLRINNHQEALKFYLDLVKNHEDYVGTYYHLGKLYEALGEKEKALATYEKGIDVARKIKDQHALSELLGVYNNLQDELYD
ncbi:Tetratricopeptide TPR_1 repeat-containing protein [Pseudopedobacter saltans DSM 12145]|uniref:Tetratricopeptide TPR_1 repeat-containing protein n=1 Tax=Pseudopedobacter saltans (strain ATCC 51119 / DSM 12145 / JCM 21818 / CCUG 39354 / LMG 10337 / NBRC 100064 / NCIMB 13643) TaxID=762903 RepID=F0S949_PSESL|nr:tetratricopeptide repeat protein [Pseudopedobacter saltans]ADY51347.1 Tetratricopeptide TPR_1 repeat-containing protein [Pseudopedobacter saltans DSM 12145]